MKKLILISISMVLCLVQAQAQDVASSTWSLAADQDATVVGQIDANAIVLSNNMMRHSYSKTEGVAGSMYTIVEGTWPGGASDATLYIEFSIVPKTGYDFTLNEISLLIYGNSTGNMRADFYYSTDPTFTTRTQIEQYVGEDIPRDTSGEVGTVMLTGLSQKITDGQALYLRVYPYHRGENQAAGRRIILNNVKFAGTTTSSSSTSIGENTFKDLKCYKIGNYINIDGLTGKSNIQVIDALGRVIDSVSTENDSFSKEVNSQSFTIIRIVDLNTKDTKVIKLS